MSLLIACPECKKHLQVPDNLLGKKVQCPECKHTFVAAVEEPEIAPKPSTATTASKPSVAPSPPATPAWEKSSKTGSKSGSKRRNSDDDDDDYDIRDRDDDDDDDDDDRPRRRSGRRRSRRLSSPSRGYSYMPHRGGMILAFGLIALIGILVVPGVPLIFGIIAWVMGNTDLAAIRAGSMDPSGEGTTQAGRIMGMISTILHLLGVLGCCCLIGVGAVNDGPNRRRRF